VLKFFTAQLVSGGDAFVAGDVRQALADESATLEHRTAATAAIGYDELVRKVLSGEGEQAVAELRALSASTPNDPLLSEFSLGRLCTSLLFTWNLPQLTLPLVEFAAERYPQSPNVQLMLGETQAALGNTAAAIAVFEQVLEQLPGNPSIQGRIEQLRGLH
jgi:predicted Zn-dependent protease